VTKAQAGLDKCLKRIGPPVADRGDCLLGPRGIDLRVVPIEPDTENSTHNITLKNSPAFDLAIQLRPNTEVPAWIVYPTKTKEHLWTRMLPSAGQRPLNSQENPKKTAGGFEFHETAGNIRPVARPSFFGLGQRTPRL
jgi:hypothetical protein